MRVIPAWQALAFNDNFRVVRLFVYAVPGIRQPKGGFGDPSAAPVPLELVPRRFFMFRITPQRGRLVVLAASAVVGMAGNASAAVTTWTNTTGNRLWTDPANWSGGVPTAADVVVLQATGSITLP